MTLSYPIAPDHATEAQWAEQRRRRALYEGCWGVYAKQAMISCIGGERSAVFAQEPDLTKNIFRSTIIQLAVLYDQEPILSREDGDMDAVRAMSEALRDAGAWELLSTVQALAIAQRECVLAVGDAYDPFSQKPSKGGISVRIVPADLCSAQADRKSPDVPYELSEYFCEDGKWKRLSWDARTHTACVFLADGKCEGKPILILDDSAFPMDEDGRRLIPYVLYHAKRTGKLFDPYYGVELADGSLKASALWTFWSHVVFDASWPQRTGINVRLAAGGSSVDGVQSVVADPATVILFDPSNPGASSQLSQWLPGGDPATLGDAIRSYASDLAMDFEISPADIQRSNGDARSGYAIQLTREGQRAAQRRYEGAFRRGDLELLRIVAARLRAQGIAMPGSGWTITYPGLPLSFEELRAAREDERADLEMGVISLVDVYQRRHPGTSREQAQARLAMLRAEGGQEKEMQPAQDTALNGAQVSSAMQIIQGISQGILTPPMAHAMLVHFFNLSEDAASSILKDARNIGSDNVRDPESPYTTNEPPSVGTAREDDPI